MTPRDPLPGDLPQGKSPQGESPQGESPQGERLFREQLEAIYTASLDAIMTFDPDGTIRTANTGAHEMFGYEPGDLRGRRLLDLMPEDYARAEGASLERDGTTSVIQLLDRLIRREGRRRDGTLVPFTAYLQRLTSAPPHRYIMVAEDMSAVSKAHARIIELHGELQEANRDLERKVRERTGQYEKTARALAEANGQLALEVREREEVTRELQRREVQLERLLFKERELGDLRSRFVSMASHEFRTPLTAMLSSAEVIAMASEDAPAIVEKHLLRIRQNIAHLRMVLEDFLELGKLDVRGVDLRLAPVSVPDFLDDVFQELELVSPSGQAIELATAGELGMTRHADNGLRIILHNLVGNAVKYSPPEAPVHVRVAREADRLVIAVTDEGIGIPEADRPLLFERFFRAANAGHLKGTGLGLHISRQYARAMGGDIVVGDNPGGRGTRFEVDLPYRIDASG